eukprot:CAMPEP_0116843020 /NCGR_PEP_ID=MMETSP0418-20121206/11849_1 /TAXON_ID=1158023 /ORGANISM="Astrosyne radiata, Strain 13vi08-1A" /LENGTH=80 /DNA_ID=CAMNT_0004473713 /DNA_START=68 /DNA_END=310 /DNA_ORIENTATION=+
MVFVIVIIAASAISGWIGKEVITSNAKRIRRERHEESNEEEDNQNPEGMKITIPNEVTRSSTTSSNGLTAISDKSDASEE